MFSASRLGIRRSGRVISLIKIFLFLFLLFQFNVNAVNAEELSLEQKAIAANVTPYSLLGEKWITLPDLAFLLRGSFRQDPISRRTEITFRDHRLVFMPGSKKALLDGEIKSMSQPTRLIAGVEAIPFAFASSIANVGFIGTPQKPLSTFQPVPTGPEKTPVPKKPPEVQVPTVSEILAETGAGKDELILVIDPGHGGHDSGAIGPYNLKEKDVNLDLTLRITDYLKKHRPKLKILLTRKDDTFLRLEERVQLANENKADIFVSIHANSAHYNRYEASGFETFFPTQKPTLLAASLSNSEDEIVSLLQPVSDRDVILRSQYLASLTQEQLADIFKLDIVPDRGIKGRNFFVLKYTNMVSVLVEVGFICNPLIELNLRTPEVRQAIAVAIAKGIVAYLDGQPLRSAITVDTAAVEEPKDE